MSNWTAPPQLFLGVASSSAVRLHKHAALAGGTLYVDERSDTAKLPFAALYTTVTDDIEPLQGLADVGLYLLCSRVIKAGEAGIYGLFPMLRHPDKSHKAADHHWRDIHAPLALQHHAAMTHYVQLSVLQTLSGQAYDGFALCGFSSLADLKEHFFTTPESVSVIAADIAKFADTDNAPRRLIAKPYSFNGEL